MKLFAAMAAMLASISVLASCGSDDEPEASDGSTTTAGSEGSGGGSARGFDGSTIRVASLGIKGQLPAAEWGARARIERFNRDKEIPGIQIEYVEFADDKQDPATALAEARRLVTTEEVFAIVGDISANNPGQYFAQQKVPYFGYAFDNTYCTEEPDESIWGFGATGCLVPSDPPEMPDSPAKIYKYAVEQTEKKSPTVALFSADNQSGHNTVKNQRAAYEGNGFKVVMAEGIVPPPPVTDYTPYVQQLLKADGGKAPDAMVCYVAVDCIPIYKQLMANSYKGIFFHTLYSDALLEALNGSVVLVGWANFNDPTPALDKMRADVKAVKADQALDVGVAAGYFSTDFFIGALKIAAKDGTKNITPESVREAASTMTFEIEGLVGPTKYPDSTVKSTPSCNTLVKSDGKAWNTIYPFSCSDKTWPVKD